MRCAGCAGHEIQMETLERMRTIPCHTLAEIRLDFTYSVNSSGIIMLLSCTAFGIGIPLSQLDSYTIDALQDAALDDWRATVKALEETRAEARA